SKFLTRYTTETLAEHIFGASAFLGWMPKASRLSRAANHQYWTCLFLSAVYAMAHGRFGVQYDNISGSIARPNIDQDKDHRNRENSRPKASPEENCRCCGICS